MDEIEDYKDLELIIADMCFFNQKSHKNFP